LVGWLVGWLDGLMDGWLVGWLDGLMVHHSVSKSVSPEPVVLLLCFTFRMQKLKLKPLQWLGK